MGRRTKSVHCADVVAGTADVITNTLEQSRAVLRTGRVSMVEKTGLSKLAIGQIWRKFELKPHLADGFTLTMDLQFVDKSWMSLAFAISRLSMRRRCMDEKSGVQALNRAQPVLPLVPGAPERRSLDYVRSGVTSLFAAADIADGTAISASPPASGCRFQEASD